MTTIELTLRPGEVPVLLRAYNSMMQTKGIPARAALRVVRSVRALEEANRQVSQALRALASADDPKAAVRAFSDEKVPVTVHALTADEIVAWGSHVDGSSVYILMHHGLVVTEEEE